jgi:hypothetical protein
LFSDCTCSASSPAEGFISNEFKRGDGHGATSLGTIGVAAATKSKTTKIKHVGTVDGMPGSRATSKW